MKDHEIIAILEGCDDAQRARVMAWARKRWPAPKKAAKLGPAQPTLDGDAWKRIVEEMQRAKPVPLPYIPPPYQPSPFTQPTSPPDWGPIPMWVTKVTCGSLGNGFTLLADPGVPYNGDPS